MQPQGILLCTYFNFDSYGGNGLILRELNNENRT
ncbi:unnamed protein product, partial [Rotaria sp. Silwood2]